MYSMGVWSLRVVEVWFFYALFPVCLVEAAVFTTLSTHLELERWVFCHKRASNFSRNSYSCALILPFYRSHVTDVFHWTIEIWTSKGIEEADAKRSPFTGYISLIGQCQDIVEFLCRRRWFQPRVAWKQSTPLWNKSTLISQTLYRLLQ